MSIKPNADPKNAWLLKRLKIGCVVGTFSIANATIAAPCVVPLRPFLPKDPQPAQEFADIIRRDFEVYVIDIQDYFRCLELERARAFEEAQEVSQDYGRFLHLVESD